MTAETPTPTSPDEARAADLDCARDAWRTFPWHSRPDFGSFAVNFLRERGLELAPVREPLECGEAPIPLHEIEGDLLAALFPDLPDSPHTRQALSMSVETIADLLAALAERDLRWNPGENGECGTLLDGPAEPDDLHVAFDCFRAVWQRDDDRAGDEGDPCRRWFGPIGIRRTWGELQRVNGPMTPDGGIAPTTPRPASTREAGVRGDDGCEGGIR